MAKLTPGTKVIYRRYNKPQEPIERVGVVKTCGRVWVDIVHQEGKLEYAKLNECFPAETRERANSPTIDTSPSTTAAAVPSTTQLVEANLSQFTALSPGCLLSYCYCRQPSRNSKGEICNLIAGTYYGYFIKYDSLKHLVHIRTNPPYKAQPSTLTLKEELVEPVTTQPAINLETGERIQCNTLSQKLN